MQLAGDIYDGLLAQDARRRGAKAALAALVLAIVGVACWFAGLFDVARILEGLPALGQIISEGTPPRFDDMQKWLSAIVDTLSMSIAGTALAVLFSLPLGFLAARNTSPHPAVMAAARGLLNLLRSIPELILGILFVAAVGFGALPGVLALGLHSIGMIGKFFSEAIEHADNGPIEAVEATGASKLQIMRYGVLPQVFPQFIDVALYRWEYNFRASTVMGMVGAGGIGFELMGALRIMQYDQVSAILLLILIMVSLVDALGGFLRKKLK